MTRVALILLLTPSIPLHASPTFAIGDYIEFGSYLNEPILWRVIHLDHNSNPLLYSEHMLCAKSFDAAVNNHENEERKKYGSNEWETSTIRQWLNSAHILCTL